MLSLYHNEAKDSSLTRLRAPKSAALPCSLLASAVFLRLRSRWLARRSRCQRHIDADIQRVQANVKYAMPPHVFRNIGKGKFEEVTKSLGPAFAFPRVGRGAAYADINNDGRLDLCFLRMAAQSIFPE